MEISKDMTIGELIRNYPSAANVLMTFGMPCVGCSSSQSETIEEACIAHRLDMNALFQQLNAIQQSKSS